MYRTILVPLDGTAEAARAIPFATTLAAGFGPGARLLLVRPARAPRGAPESDAGIAALEVANDYLRTVAAPLARSGLDVTTLTPYGTLTECVPRDAEAHGADVIVAATHGRWGVDRLLHGNIAGQILRESSVPVMCIGPNVAAPIQIARITVPLDGDAFAAAILPAVSELAATLSAAMDVVGIIPPAYMALNDSEGPLPAWVLERLELRQAGSNYAMLENKTEVQELKASLTRNLEFWVRQLCTVGAQPSVQTYYAPRGPSIAAAVIRAAGDLGADLIALRTHARPPVPRLLLGSVADEIVRSSPLPTLLFTSRTLPLGQSATVEIEHHPVVV